MLLTAVVSLLHVTLAPLADTVAVRAVADSGTVYDGRRAETSVRIPRVEDEATVDGVLDDAAWRRAARLTGFSQYAPTDGVAAADSTEVLVWYSATAIHFGIRAFEAHGAVHATLADRDRIGGDDHVQLFLGTFDDGRQATVVGVNPLGVQMDGTLLERGVISSGGFTGATAVRESPDLSPDFVFQSKGRLTSNGYEVEIRVPFKSLRYQPSAEQRWRLQVVRQVQHSGAEETWTPARRAAASFLAQSGSLEGLADLRRGLVLDVNPEVTARAEGAPEGDGWNYDRRDPEVGGNVRWGITNNLTLNGTVNPDFSQVEADAAQFSFDPRNALSFPEKRPFFLEGIEQFSTPNNLVYTRRIVRPVGAAKLTGKLSGTDIALLGAVDDRDASPTGEDHPIFALARVQRDLGAQSRIGVLYTERSVAGDYNRVADIDGRFVFGRIYDARVQLAASRTSVGGEARSAPLWEARIARNGRTFGFRYVVSGIDEDFRTWSGFISRPGVARANLNHRVTLYGQPDALVQRFTHDIALDGTWRYANFVDGRDMQDKKLHFNFNAALRGGWSAGTSVLVETFGYDPDYYGTYRVLAPRADGTGSDTLPFVGTPRIGNLDYVVSLNTPEFKHFSGNLFLLWGKDENFFEWASADIWYATLNLAFRPTEQLRFDVDYQHQQFDRRTDGSTVGVRKIPRLKMEYQITRSIFVRVVGEYDADRTDELRDDSRTGYPLLVCDRSGASCERVGATSRNTLRGDWLFSYRPTPGTVFYAGYGSLRAEPEPLRFDRLRRVQDGFFVKASYLWRV